MDVDREICDQWVQHHALDPQALHWLATHAEPGDAHPIITALDELRRRERGD